MSCKSILTHRTHTSAILNTQHTQNTHQINTQHTHTHTINVPYLFRKRCNSPSISVCRATIVTGSNRKFLSHVWGLAWWRACAREPPSVSSWPRSSCLSFDGGIFSSTCEHVVWLCDTLGLSTNSAVRQDRMHVSRLGFSRLTTIRLTVSSSVVNTTESMIDTITAHLTVMQKFLCIF